MPPSKRRWPIVAIGAAVAAAIAGTLAFTLRTPEEPLVVVAYTATDAVLPNPGRGWYDRVDILTQRDFDESVAGGVTLLHSYVRLDAYRQSAVPAELVATLEAGLDAVRDAGLKIILRFAYNEGPYPDSQPDASEEQITEHLEQLAPVLERNADVISSLEAGFVGAWGEWHSSTHGLDHDPAAKRRILAAILDAVPASIPVAARYPSDLRASWSAPLDDASGTDGSAQARAGSHLDCFLASEPDDWGTWGRDGENGVEADKDYVAGVGTYSVVGGETCNPSPPARSNCDTALSELGRLHFSYLNRDYEPTTLGVLAQQGCLGDIERRLGYRFELRSAGHPERLDLGQTEMRIAFTVRNTGFAAPFLKRPVYAVLEGEGRNVTVQLETDARRWEPSGEITVEQSIPLPGDLPEGDYRLSLWLPDPADSLRENPAYAIRFASSGAWDVTTGYTLLAEEIPLGPVTEE